MLEMNIVISHSMVQHQTFVSQILDPKYIDPSISLRTSVLQQSNSIFDYSEMVFSRFGEKTIISVLVSWEWVNIANIFPGYYIEITVRWKVDYLSSHNNRNSRYIVYLLFHYNQFIVTNYLIIILIGQYWKFFMIIHNI